MIIDRQAVKVKFQAHGLTALDPTRSRAPGIEIDFILIVPD